MALTNEDLQAIAGLLQPIQNEVKDMRSEMEDMKSDIQGMKSEMKDMKSEMKDMKSEMEGMKSDIQEIKPELQQLQIDMKEVKRRVISMELTVENEIRVNIQRVAEGHLDLYRKLNECIKLSSDVHGKQEIQDIYINMFNNKLKVLA